MLIYCILKNNNKGYSSAVEHLVYTCANAFKKIIELYDSQKNLFCEIFCLTFIIDITEQ